MSGRTAKACEPCRARDLPCNHCSAKPAGCTYRHFTRMRRRHAIGSPGERKIDSSDGRSHHDPTSSRSSAEPSTHVKASSRSEEVYQSVSATESNAPTGHVQLYYGSSSNFAFLQQLHRSILSDENGEYSTPGEVQEGGAGLDMFMQRELFFGTPLLIDLNTAISATLQQKGLTLQLAMLFLDKFLAGIHLMIPFYERSELVPLIRTLCADEGGQNLQPQARAIIQVILAIGAVSTEHLELAEVLFTRANAEASMLDETVNLGAVQLSSYLALYQVSMGRPNSAYLHLGTACRKAYAMGLHKDMHVGGLTTDQADYMRKRQITMWSLYAQDCWQSYALGRPSALRIGEITCPFPSNSPFICSLAQLASILARSADAVYGQRLKSLWDVYKAAESIHAELRQFAEQNHLAFASKNDKASKTMETVYLHNLYYHTIVLSFRPFLIAGAAREGKARSAAPLGSDDTFKLRSSEMWLRQARRNAVDAAQDQITFLLDSIRTIGPCKGERYNAFFIESCSAVLMYDSLQQHYTFSHNLEYIKAAIQCLAEMLPGEPSATAERSLRQVLSVVEREIMGPPASMPKQQPDASASTAYSSGTGAGSDPTLANNTGSTNPSSHINGNLGLPTDYRSIQFPTPKTTTADHVIYVRDRLVMDPLAQYQEHPRSLPQHQLNQNPDDCDDPSTNGVNNNNDNDVDFQAAPGLSMLDSSNFDVFTTDLYHFFPMDTTPTGSGSSPSSGTPTAAGGRAGFGPSGGPMYNP